MARIFCGGMKWQDRRGLEFRILRKWFPVIFLTFSGVKAESFEQARKEICNLIKRLYNQYDFLLDSDCLNSDEKEFYKNISVEMEDYAAAVSIQALSGYLSNYYGKKVLILLDEYGLSGQASKVQDWYDGFTFGNQHDIYNPWSILNFLSEKRFISYWVNTSSNGLVDKLVREGSADIKIAVENLMKGIPLLAEIDEQIVFSSLEEDENAVWSLFLASMDLPFKGRRS